MTYRTAAPPPAAPRRLIQPGEAVRPTTEALRIHRQCWGMTVCTPDEYRPYAPPPMLGEVEAVTSEEPLRLLRVQWENGETSDWGDESLDPLSGR